MQTSKTITLSLGKQQQILDSLVESGEFASHSEAARAAVKALVREREAANEIWRAKIQEAVDDPRPDIPAEEVFSNLRAHHRVMVKAAKRGI